MTKKELISMTAAEMGVSKKAAEMSIDAIFGVIAGQMRQPGRDVYLRGFGRFSSKIVSARTGRNPKTGEEIEIPEKLKVIFKMAKGE